MDQWLPSASEAIVGSLLELVARQLTTSSSSSSSPSTPATSTPTPTGLPTPTPTPATTTTTTSQLRRPPPGVRSHPHYIIATPATQQSGSSFATVDRALGAAATAALAYATYRIVSAALQRVAHNENETEDGQQQRQRQRRYSRSASSSSSIVSSSNTLLVLLRFVVQSLLYGVQSLRFLRLSGGSKNLRDEEEDDDDGYDYYYTTTDKGCTPTMETSQDENNWMQHWGSCHCGTVRFRLRAPTTLNAWDSGQGRIRYPHYRTLSRHFQLLSGVDELALYYVQLNDAEDKESGSPPAMAAHAFCRNCSVPILRAPDSRLQDVEVNLQCLSVPPDEDEGGNASCQHSRRRSRIRIRRRVRVNVSIYRGKGTGLSAGKPVKVPSSLDVAPSLSSSSFPFSPFPSSTPGTPSDFAATTGGSEGVAVETAVAQLLRTSSSTSAAAPAATTTTTTATRVTAEQGSMTGSEEEGSLSLSEDESSSRGGGGGGAVGTRGTLQEEIVLDKPESSKLHHDSDNAEWNRTAILAISPGGATTATTTTKDQLKYYMKRHLPSTSSSVQEQDEQKQET